MTHVRCKGLTTPSVQLLGQQETVSSTRLPKGQLQLSNFWTVWQLVNFINRGQLSLFFFHIDPVSGILILHAKYLKSGKNLSRLSSIDCWCTGDTSLISCHGNVKETGGLMGNFFSPVLWPWLGIHVRPKESGYFGPLDGASAPQPPTASKSLLTASKQSPHTTATGTRKPWIAATL